MDKKLASIMIFLVTGVLLTSCGRVYAQNTASSDEARFLEQGPEKLIRDITSELPSSPIRDAVLQLIKPEELFRTFQQYIKVPLPGTGVKEIEVDKPKLSELNLQVTKETGVDLIKFFKFVGKILVIVLEAAAQILKGLLQSVESVQ